jgi:hypothetical protein
MRGKKKKSGEERERKRWHWKKIKKTCLWAEFKTDVSLLPLS